MSIMCSVAVAGTLSWTEREIRQQPKSWLRTLENVDDRRSEIDEFISPLRQLPALKIILTGAGSSAFIGDSIAPWLAQQTGSDVVAVPTTDLVTSPEDYLSLQQPTLLVSFGRSGNSPESVAAVELADRLVTRCWHLAITCNEAGRLYQHALSRANALPLLLPEETHDRGFAMTSSITSMMLCCLAAFAPRVFNRARFADVAARCQQIIDSQGDFTQSPFGEQPWQRIVYLGSGGLQGVARESALKVLELTAGRLTAFYDTPAGFRHGPKSLVNGDTLVVVLVSARPYTRQYDLDLLAELRNDRLAMRVVAIASAADTAVVAGPHILLPPARDFNDLEQAFCFLMYAQIFALRESIKAGIAPDSPSASGTVNRVVKGVTIHPWQA